MFEIEPIVFEIDEPVIVEIDCDVLTNQPVVITLEE